MNMIETAKELGFSGAAVIDTAQLVFMPEYRVFCEENLCGNYNLNPACPPGERHGRGDESPCPDLRKNAGPSDYSERTDGLQKGKACSQSSDRRTCG